MLSLDDFDSDIFFNKSKFIIETDAITTVCDIGPSLLKTNSSCVIEANRGYGVSTAFDYLKKIQRNRVVIITITSVTTYKGLLISILEQTGVSYSKIDFTYARVHHLHKSVVHFLIEEHQNKLLLIFNNISETAIRKINFFLELIRSINSDIAILIRIPKKNIPQLRIKRKGNLRPEFNEFIKLEEPSYEEKYSICKEVGITDNEIIDTLVLNSQNFIELNRSIDRLRNNAAQQFGFS